MKKYAIRYHLINATTNEEIDQVTALGKDDQDATQSFLNYLDELVRKGEIKIGEIEYKEGDQDYIETAEEGMMHENPFAMNNEIIAKIARAIANKNEAAFDLSAYSQVMDAINWAWENWEESVLSTYFVDGIKPNAPTSEFREEWTKNELSANAEQWQHLIDSYMQQA